MREIALDTQAATAVAIIEDGRVIARAHNDSGRHHAESITPLVREVLQAAGLPAQLADAGIDRVLVGTGPAPFTGLRAGLVSARVLARVAGVPAYGVSALDVIARQGLDLLPPDTRVYAIADARRRELYWGSYLAAGPDDVTLEGRLEVGDVTSLLAAMRHAPGLVVAGAPIPAELRVATLDDLQSLVDLEAVTFPEDPWTPFMLADELSSPASRYWIATNEAGDPVGYGGVKVGGDQADVMTIGVAPHARGRGVGRAILDALLDWARQVGAAEIFLDVRPSNEGAIALYNSRGFVEIGRRPRYFRNPVEEAVEMRAPLTRAGAKTTTK